ncbi:MAG: hypothetical protein CMJ23_02025 [Phycisphaerae bacterium]|nr:hypothetical protein [Phycisphaerae bacterium]
MITTTNIIRRAGRTIHLAVAMLLLTAFSPAAQAMPPIAPPAPAVAEKAEPTSPPESLASPRATLKTLLDAIPTDGASNMTVAIECFPEAAIPKSTTVRDVTIQQLVDLLNWLGWREEGALATLSPESDAAGPKAYTLLPWTGAGDAPFAERSKKLSAIIGDEPAITLERDQIGAWRFNANSISSGMLDAARDAIRTIGSRDGGPMPRTNNLEDWIGSLGMPWLMQKVVFVEVWQWFAIAMVILLGLILDLLIRIIGGRLLRPLMRRLHEDVEDQSMRRAVRGFGLVGSTMTWFLFIPLLQLPLVAFAILQPASRFTFVLALFWCGWRSTDLLGDVLLGRARRSETKADDIIVPMVRKTLKVMLVIFALLNLSPMLGLNLGPLLAAIGVGSFGFAFAFKNSLENLFGSVTVILDRPFQVGDWVIIDDVEGTVESVGLRSTRIRTFYNSLVSVPNSNLITRTVDNYGLRKYRRWKADIGILYGTPIPRIEAFCEAIRELIREHPYTRKDYYQVWVNEFGPSSINILVYVFWEAPDWQTELRERHRFMIDIMRMANELGVEFAFPSQTVYLQRGSKPATPVDSELDEAADRHAAMRQGRVAVRKVTEEAAWRTETIPKYRFLNAEETARIDQIEDEDRATQLEQRLGNRERHDGLPESGTDPDNPDFTEQRDAGG